jgi:hypothetical protein
MRNSRFCFFRLDPAGGLFGTLKLSEFGAVAVLGDLPSSALCGYTKELAPWSNSFGSRKDGYVVLAG